MKSGGNLAAPFEGGTLTTQLPPRRRVASASFERSDSPEHAIDGPQPPARFE